MKRNVKKLLCFGLSALILVLCPLSVSAMLSSNGTCYAVNVYGETYGNYLQALELGYEADLILAEGINGTLGYVRSSDLEDHASSPVNATNAAIDRYIPLYTADGETVVGKYLLTATGDPAQTRSEYTYGKPITGSPPGYQGTAISGIRGEAMGVNAQVKISATMEVSAGWLGIQNRIYKKSTGAMVASSSWSYNTVQDDSFHADLYHFSILNEEYYSAGAMRLWNTNIDDYWTYRAPASSVAIPG